MNNDTSINPKMPDCQGTYMNIATVLQNVASEMKKEMQNAKSINGTITMVEIQQVFVTLENMINNSLSQVTNQRIVIELGKNYEHINEDSIRDKKTTNKIRLSESQLHNVIKESVKQVLSELNWKTYQNAAKKSHLKALDNDDMSDNEYHNELDRSRRFRQAAEDAFNRDYGTNDTKLHSDMHGSKKRAPGGGYFPFHDDSYIEMKKGSDTYGTYYPYGYNKDFEWSYGYDSSKSRPEWDRAKQELKHYQNGDFDYDDEKGWHLKDNMDESIRRAIKNALR